MAKFLDKTQEQWDELVDEWHTDETITCSLQEYLKLNDIEFLKFGHGITDENITDEEALKKSNMIAKDVVTELVIKPQLENVIKHIPR